LKLLELFASHNTQQKSDNCTYKVLIVISSLIYNTLMQGVTFLVFNYAQLDLCIYKQNSRAI